MEDPPAYTQEAAALLVPPTRSIQDIRSLILGNAYILRPKRPDEHIEVVVAKYGPKKPESATGPRTYITTNSRVAITINDASPSTNSDSESTRQATTALQTTSGLVEHRAFVVTRKASEPPVNVIIEGQPKPTLEEALNWLLDRTETMVAGLISTHGRTLPPKCCGHCARNFQGI